MAVDSYGVEIAVREEVKYTAKGHGYYRVLVEGEEVSKHSAEREALESAVNSFEEGLDVRVIHDYEVQVVKNYRGKIVKVRVKTHKLKLNTPMAIVSYTAPGLGQTNPDSVPDSFNFGNQTNVAISQTITSNYITVEGTTLPASISISGANNPQYQIETDPPTNVSGTVAPGVRVRVLHESSAFPGQTIETFLTIGGVQRSFLSTTTGAPVGTILWNAPANDFYGYSKGNASSVTVGTVFTNTLSGDAPLVVHASASNTICTGTNPLDGSATDPYMHLEHRWSAVNNDLTPITSANEITNPNTKQAVNMYTDQIGGEAAFIFHEPGTYRINLTSRSVDGASDTGFATITVDAPTYSHKWFDPDFGAGGDGFQAWDGSAVTNATYTESTGALSQTGAFAAYDHTVATSETYLTDNSNWIYLSAPAPIVGWYRIASKTNDNEIILLDKIGSDQTGVQSSAGPLNTFNPATDVASNTAHHFKVSKIYEITSRIDVGNASNVLFMGYGSGQYTIKAGLAFSGNGMIGIDFGDDMPNLLNIHKMILDGNGANNVNVGTRLFTMVTSANTVVSEYLFDRCQLYNHQAERTVIDQSDVALTSVFWGTTLDNRIVGNSVTKKGTYIGGCKDGSYSTIVGTRNYASSNDSGSRIREHHFYPSGNGGHRLRAFNDFLGNQNDGANADTGVNFCFNETCSLTNGSVANYLSYFGNRFRNSKNGITGSNVSNAPAPAGIFNKVTIISNSFDGTDGLEDVLGSDSHSIFSASTEDCFIGHNITIDVLLGLWTRWEDTATSQWNLDNNITYDCQLAQFSGGNGVYQLVNNTVHHTQDIDTGTGERVISYNSAQAASHYIQDNQFWAPNDLDGNIYTNSSTIEDLTALNGHLNNSGNSEANPGFADPASNDYRAFATDVKFEVVNLDTLAGSDFPNTQEINLTPGFGTPKGCLILFSMDRKDPPFFDGGGYNSGSFAVGFSDGTNERCVFAMLDAESSPNPQGQECQRALWDTHAAFRVQSTNNSGVVHSYTCTFGTDQITLNHDDGRSPEIFELTVIAIGGSDVQEVIVGSDSLGSGAGTVPITIGHEPDLLFTITANSSTVQGKGLGSGGVFPSSIADIDVSYGVAINDGSLSQACMGVYSINATRSNSQTTSAIYNDSVLAGLSEGSTEDYSAAVSSYTATGVNITTTASALNAVFGYMSVKFARSVNMAIVDASIPTGGNMTISGAGFQPGFGLGYWLDGPSAYNTAQDVSMAITATAFDASTIGSMVNRSPNGIPLTDGGVGAAWARGEESLAIYDPSVANTIGAESTTYTFNSDGVEFTMTNNPTNAVLGRVLLIGAN